MKAIFAIVLLGLIACATAGILSPYVGYTGYYAASPVVSRVGVVSPYVSPYVSSYYAGSPVVAPVAYTSGVYSPYAAYSYLLKK